MNYEYIEAANSDLINTYPTIPLLAQLYHIRQILKINNYLQYDFHLKSITYSGKQTVQGIVRNGADLKNFFFLYIFSRFYTYFIIQYLKNRHICPNGSYGLFITCR
jgi:hypothetical protein